MAQIDDSKVYSCSPYLCNVSWVGCHICDYWGHVLWWTAPDWAAMCRQTSSLSLCFQCTEWNHWLLLVTGQCSRRSDVYPNAIWITRAIEHALQSVVRSALDRCCRVCMWVGLGRQIDRAQDWAPGRTSAGLGRWVEHVNHFVTWITSIGALSIKIWSDNEKRSVRSDVFKLLALTLLWLF